MLEFMARRRDDSSLPHLPSDPQGKRWPDTPWSLLLRWKDLGAQDRKGALDRILGQYYKPVYRFFQRVLGLHGDDLTNATQDFFVRFIEKDFLKNLDHQGSFRAFLKVACRRHCINWMEKNRARAVALDGTPEPAMPSDRSDALLDEELRKDYLDGALERVRARLRQEGKDVYLQVLEARMRRDDEGRAPELAAIALEVGRGVYDVRNYLTRVRALFREALHEIAAERTEQPKQELEDLDLLRFAP